MPRPDAPRILTRQQARGWLLAIGRADVRLPRALNVATSVWDPAGGAWTIEALITGAFLVARWRPDDTDHHDTQERTPRP